MPLSLDRFVVSVQKSRRGGSKFCVALIHPEGRRFDAFHCNTLEAAEPFISAAMNQREELFKLYSAWTSGGTLEYIALEDFIENLELSLENPS